MTKNEENLQNSKCLMRFLLNLVSRCFPIKENATKKLFFDFGIFWLFFAKKQPKLIKNEENRQNLNRLMKFSEIWYVDASQQQQKGYKETFFGFLPFSAVF